MKIYAITETVEYVDDQGQTKEAENLISVHLTEEAAEQVLERCCNESDSFWMMVLETED